MCGQKHARTTVVFSAASERPARAAQSLCVKALTVQNQPAVDKYLFNAEGLALIGDAVFQRLLIKNRQVGIISALP